MDASQTTPLGEIVKAKTARVVRLHRRGFRLTEIAFLERIPVFAVDACLNAYYDEPRDGDPTPAEIAEEAAKIKAANLAAMQGGCEPMPVGSRLLRRATR